MGKKFSEQWFLFVIKEISNEYVLYAIK